MNAMAVVAQLLAGGEETTRGGDGRGIGFAMGCEEGLVGTGEGGGCRGMLYTWPSGDLCGHGVLGLHCSGRRKIRPRVMGWATLLPLEAQVHRRFHPASFYLSALIF